MTLTATYGISGRRVNRQSLFFSFFEITLLLTISHAFNGLFLVQNEIPVTILSFIYIIMPTLTVRNNKPMNRRRMRRGTYQNRSKIAAVAKFFVSLVSSIFLHLGHSMPNRTKNAVIVTDFDEIW